MDGQTDRQTDRVVYCLQTLKIDRQTYRQTDRDMDEQAGTQIKDNYREQTY